MFSESMNLKDYKLKISNVIIELENKRMSSKDLTTISRIDNELKGYHHSLPEYRILEYQLFVNYYDVKKQVSIVDYCVDEAFFKSDFDLDGFNKLYIFSGLMGLKKTIKSLVFQKLGKPEIKLLNMNLNDKKIFSAYHVLYFEDFKRMLESIIENIIS